jgi:hypothetical protein
VVCGAASQARSPQYSVDGHYLRNLRNRSPLEQSVFVAGRDFIFCFYYTFRNPQRTPAIWLGFSYSWVEV